MGGYFGVVSKKNCILDVFFGTDYHSHLGTAHGGVASFDRELGFQRQIHNIQNAPFRTKFENIGTKMSGTSAIGFISDTYPEPLLIRSNLGLYAIGMVGVIHNDQQLTEQYLSFSGGHFDAMTGGKINGNELIAAMIDQKSSFVDGIRFAQNRIEGTASILILKDGGNIIAARDLLGRIPMSIGQNEQGYCVAFEPFSYTKLGYEPVKELGPGEIVEISPDGITVIAPAQKKKKICAFLWTYYGYPTSIYEGINVEAMRYRNGHILAKADGKQELDYVGGVPDSGTPHAIGYANESHVPFARPFIKYTPTWPRSFMPSDQSERNMVAKMKQIPVLELIRDKKLLFVDDSIVRGTQLRETVDFLYENGAKEVHIRSACPPILYGCKYLNFSRATSDMELLCRNVIMELEGEEGFQYLEEYADTNTQRGKAMREAICKKLHFSSLEYQSIDGLMEAIGLPECDICTYCWNGKE